jgi:tartrate-resistant acid phosphatase type 5
VSIGRRVGALAVWVVAGVMATASLGAAAQPSSPDVRFAVKGDWGYGGSDQAAVTRRMCAAHQRDPFAFVLTTGDNFYRPDGEATASNWSRPEACLIAAGIPWRAAWGNHDSGRSGTGSVLSSPDRWYTFRPGPAVRVIVLDANQPENAEQRRFLATTLKNATERFRVVAFHQPAYTAGLHAPGEIQQREWVPLFRRFGVALVLQGHNHAYERIVRDGVTYITTGGGGSPVYPCLRLTEGLRACWPVHHFLAVNVWADRLVVRAVNPDGSTLERVRIPTP